MQDLRKVKTEALIQNAFIELLKEKNLYHISITDICNRAQINRSTFYSHYEDFSVFLNEIMNSTSQGLVKAVSSTSESDFNFFKKENAYECYHKWFCHIHDHQEIFSLLLGPNGSLEFRDMLINQGIDWYNQILQPYASEFEKNIPQDILVNYIVNAHYGLLLFYLKNPQKYDAEYMAKKMVELTFSGTFLQLGIHNMVAKRDAYT